MNRQITSAIGGLSMLLAACAGNPEVTPPVVREPASAASVQTLQQENPSSGSRLTFMEFEPPTQGGRVLCGSLAIFQRAASGEEAVFDRDMLAAAIRAYQRNEGDMTPTERRATVATLTRILGQMPRNC